MARVYCLVSGGCDSVVACHYYCGSYDVDCVIVHASTPLEDPRNIEYVREFARYMGARLVITKPRYGLEKIMDWGLPGLRNRWCMRVWKQEPMRKAIPKGSTIVLGIRREESMARRKRYPLGFYNDRYYNAVLPIVNWTKQQVLDYIGKHGIPLNPLWNNNVHSSHDCSICLLYATIDDLLWIRRNNPKIYRKLVMYIKLAKAFKGYYPRFLRIQEKQLLKVIHGG